MKKIKGVKTLKKYPISILLYIAMPSSFEKIKNILQIHIEKLHVILKILFAIKFIAL